MVVPIESMMLLVQLVEILIQVVELPFCISLLKVLKMQPGEIVRERFLQLGLFPPVTLHQRADSCGILRP